MGGGGVTVVSAAQIEKMFVRKLASGSGMFSISARNLNGNRRGQVTSHPLCLPLFQIEFRFESS